MKPTRKLRVALLGCGTVGGGVRRILADRSQEFEERHGVAFEITGILVRDVAKEREVPRRLLTQDGVSLVRHADVIVEALGGIEPARTLVLDALERGKAVITANKKLVAHCQEELAAASRRGGGAFAFEAAVCGAVPVVSTLRNGLRGADVRSMTAVVNATCNFVLDRAARFNEPLPLALARARALGYAEADASQDIEGHDAAEKLAILSGLALGIAPDLSDFSPLGLSQVTPLDARLAAENGHALCHIVQAERLPDGRIAWHVGPAWAPRRHPLARLLGAETGVVLEGAASGPLLLQGQGAGSLPTASAMVSDLLAVALDQRSFGFSGWLTARRAAAEVDWHGRHYLRLTVPAAQSIERVLSGFAAEGVELLAVRLYRDRPESRVAAIRTGPAPASGIAQLARRFNEWDEPFIARILGAGQFIAATQTAEVAATPRRSPPHKRPELLIEAA